MPAEFRNEPFTDFTQPSEKAAFEKALATVAAKKGGEHPLVIGGERFILPDKIRSVNPARKTEVLGTFQGATPELAAKAVDVALAAFATWSKVPAAKRAQYLFDASAVLRERKHEFSAAMVLEVGKSWAEADADTAEAIDFMEFYGREMLRYAGEQNELVYLPLGVGVVIPPWNFPLAIMVGMSTAAIVAGNTVVLKPSSDTPWIAWMFFEVMEQVGLPPGVLNFVTGSGGTVGNALVGHPKVRFVSFTGSKETGLHINRLAAETAPGQIWIKRVVA
ncbi:MAG TPA: aldehyde dehydrogenase family protein, partial [Candidatus Eisenbacteria bacterium]